MNEMEWEEEGTDKRKKRMKDSISNPQYIVAAL